MISTEKTAPTIVKFNGATILANRQYSSTLRAELPLDHRIDRADSSNRMLLDATGIFRSRVEIHIRIVIYCK